jgi:membrane-bound metal-dependent hydrolase YbcI (DUF457 family)
VNPVVHAELSWLGAQRLPDRRDRLLVTLAGVLPDLDGLTIVASQDLYGRWHHVLTHGFLSALLISGLLAAFARRRLAVFGLALAMFHLHLLCDLLGSGPGWPLFYFWPFDGRQWFWEGQWDLASWQNGLVGLAATLAVLGCALPFQRTIVELFSSKADAQVVAAVRQRFGRRAPP